MSKSKVDPETAKLMQMGPNIIHFHERKGINETLLDSTIQNRNVLMGTFPNKAVGNFEYSIINNCLSS